MDSLRAAFDAYLHVVASKTQVLRVGPQSRRGLTRVLHPESMLRTVVEEELEKGAEFKNLTRGIRPAFETLVRRTGLAFPDDLCPVLPASDNALSEALRAFFRRSGAYSQYLRRSDIDVGNLFERFEAALKQAQRRVRFLAPLEFVRLSRDVHCGSFSIQRFSREDLDTILQTVVNRVFCAAPDTEKLCKYWFVVADDCQSALAPSHVFSQRDLEVRDWDDVLPSWQRPHGPIKMALEVLSLFDWKRAASWSLAGTREGWGRPRLAFVILTDDALLRDPPSLPDCSRVPRKPVFHARLEEDVSSELESFSRDTGSLLARYRAALSVTPRQKRSHRRKGQHPELHFLEIAMTYFVRAFQTEGLDQLLWHWVAIEALVGGESDEPVCSTIRDRLKKMLGSAESGQEEIKKQFEKLYRLRCDLVHGNLYLGRVPGTDLYELRELVRRAILKVASLIIPADDVSPLPSRAQLLSVLDSSEAHDDNGEAET